MNTNADTQKKRRVIKRYSNRKLYDTRDSAYVTLLDVAKMVRAGEDVRIIDNATKEDKTEVTLALAISEELRAKHRSVPLGTLRNLLQEWGGSKLLASLREGPIRRFMPDEPAGTADVCDCRDAGAAVDSADSGDSAHVERHRGATDPQRGDESKESQGSRELEALRGRNDLEQSQQAEAGKQQANGSDDGKTPTDQQKAAKHKRERASLAEIVASSRHTLDQWQHAIDERVRAVLPNVALLLDIQAEVRRLSARVQRIERELHLEHLAQNQPVPPHPDRAKSAPESKEESTFGSTQPANPPSLSAKEPSESQRPPGVSVTVESTEKDN